MGFVVILMKIESGSTASLAFSFRRMIDLEDDIQICVFSIAVTIFLIHDVFPRRAFKFTDPAFRLSSSCAD